MSERLKEQLMPLYEKLALIDPHLEYETFCAQWGEDYQEGGIMFMGRAVNDWKAQGDRNTEGMFTEGSSNQIFMCEDQVKWVETERYDKKSAFWRVVKSIAQMSSNDEQGWFKHIVWSNLYKLSPTGGGNPSYKLREIQFETCLEILKVELEVFKPKFVVLLNGPDWYADFVCKLAGSDEFGRINLDIVDSKFWNDSNYMAYVYKIGETYFIGSVHPQGKPEKEHADVIVEMIKKFSV